MSLGGLGVVSGRGFITYRIIQCALCLAVWRWGRGSQEVRNGLNELAVVALQMSTRKAAFWAIGLEPSSQPQTAVF